MIQRKTRLRIWNGWPDEMALFLGHLDYTWTCTVILGPSGVWYEEEQEGLNVVSGSAGEWLVFGGGGVMWWWMEQSGRK